MNVVLNDFLVGFRSQQDRLFGVRSERGVTVVEYAIMLVLIAITVAGSSPGVRDAIVNTFAHTADVLNNAATSP